MSVRFVTDSEIGNEIIDLINKAEEKIILVSPYNNKWKEERPDMLKALRKASSDRSVIISAYYNNCKETKVNQYPTKLFPNLSGVSVPLLHAKLYANESTVLVTSHNLTKGSLNNREIGLVIEDTNLYREIMKYVNTLRDGESKARSTAKTRKGKVPKTAQNVMEASRSRSDVRTSSGWKTEVLDCIRKLKKQKFTNQEFYSRFTNELSRLHPNVRDVESAIRVQFQALEKDGVLESAGRGHWSYRLRRKRNAGRRAKG